MTVPDDNSIRALIARFHIEVLVGYSEDSDQKGILGNTKIQPEQEITRVQN